MSGVALPKTSGTFLSLHIYLAISFASYLGAISDLYEPSCSSSIITIPKFSTGANIAERAPIIILAFPSLILCHWSYLSPTDSLLCSTAIFSFPNLAINLFTVCGVNDISGTNNMLDLCSFSVFSINCK